jgi:ribosomal protein L16 Arg81 hydroxylase
LFLALKRDLETIKLLRTDLERKNDELEKLRALYDAVTVQHKSLLAEREREKTRLVMGNKPYQPDRFTQVLSSNEAIHTENEQLKHLVNIKCSLDFIF